MLCSKYFAILCGKTHKQPFFWTLNYFICMKKLFSFFCCMLLSIAAWGDVVKVTVDDVAYYIDTDAKTAEVTYPNDSKPNDGDNRSSYTGDITIPAQITYSAETYDVTSIGEYAFYRAKINSLTLTNGKLVSIGEKALGKARLTSLEIPKSVTTIGDKALKESYISSLTLKEGLLSIGKEAIYNTDIKELKIPNSVTSLGQSALSENSQLFMLTIGENCTNWGAWVFWRSSGAYDVYMNCEVVPSLPDNQTFDDTHKTLIHVKPSLFDSFLGDSNWSQYNIVTELGTVDGIKYLKDGRGNAYVTYPNDSKPGSSNLNTYSGDIVIPATITYEDKTYNVIGVDDYAFRYATGLTSLTLSEGLLSIGEEAIYKTGITELTIPNSVTNLGQYSLAYNENLVIVSFGKNVDANSWRACVLYRESGAYDVYMNCNSKPSVPDKYTFDHGYKTTVHVMPNVADAYNADSYWGGQYKVVGDLDKTFLYLQNIIALNESFLANEVGTDPGFYSSANPNALSTAITAAKALTPSASADDIAAAISAINSAKDDYSVNPLTEGYYYIENVYNGKFMESYPKPEPEKSGILNGNFKQDLKFYFKLIQDGDDWLIQGNDPDHMYFGATNGEYATVRVENTYKQKITLAGIGKYIIQYNDGSALSDPYANTGDWVTFKNYSKGSADEARMYWRFRNAEILSKSDVASKVTAAVGNNDTSLDLSGYLLANDVTASDMQAASTNLLVKVASTSGITGQNIVNNGECANLVLTDGKPFGYTEDITATNATYSRSVTNTFGTICLPYAVSSNSDVQYYTLNSLSGSTLYLTAQTDIEAGKPAIFEMKNNVTTLTATATDATIKGSVPTAADATLKLIGTFNEQVITDAEELAKDYYISGDKFRQANSSLTVKPFRAYFTTTSGNNVKMFNLSVLEEEETAINNVQSSISNVQSIFDANGVELQSLRKGLNIVKMNNGNVQKIMVK